MNYVISCCFCLLVLLSSSIQGQVASDTSFHPQLKHPRYSLGKGTKVYIDNAHHNYHTAAGRYQPFAAVLRADGYEVRETNQLFSTTQLDSIKILIISNALNEQNRGNWSLPVHSAFTNDELVAVKNWVARGGRLFLIADHMPFAGAAGELAAQFGFSLLNCFALDNRQRTAEIFTRGKQSLITDQTILAETDIDTVVTFTGSAFELPAKATGILKLNGYTLLSPQQAWQFNDDTPSKSGDNYYQLAYSSFGKGKIILSGEAAMFTSQIANGSVVGLSHPQAKDNLTLLLRLIHWLDEDY